MTLQKIPKQISSPLVSEYHPELSEGRKANTVQAKLQRQANLHAGHSKTAEIQLQANQFSTEPIQKKSNDTGLPDQLKSGVEALSGISMHDVKVHYNSSKPAQLQAHAYAQGTDIHVASGQEKHLAHEAWHVVQQKQGRVQATAQMKAKIAINDDSTLEKEADTMGAKALQYKKTDASQGLLKEQNTSDGFQHIQLARKRTAARGKNHFLIGTTHGDHIADQSGYVPHDMQQNSAIVLEYPSLHGTGNTSYTNQQIGTIRDTTQASLARRGRDNAVADNLTLIGADGRKAFDNQGNIHAITIRNKERNADYAMLAQQIIPPNFFKTMGEKYVDRCLGFVQGGVDFIAQRMSAYVLYMDGTDVPLVLRKTYERMRHIVRQLPKDRRLSIKRKVLSKMDSDLHAAMTNYRASKNEYIRQGYFAALVETTNTDYFNAFNDSLANLLLYTEVLVNSNQNITVAYGSEHLPPLQQLLTETWATKRNKTRMPRR